MNLLLDTHALLWFVVGDEQLSQRARVTIEDPDTVSYVSMASWWEMAIKRSLGKLDMEDSLEQFMAERTDEGFRILPIEFHHLPGLVDLPFHHRDFFDRLIISQAQQEEMPVCTADRSFSAYSIPIIW